MIKDENVIFEEEEEEEEDEETSPQIDYRNYDYSIVSAISACCFSHNKLFEEQNGILSEQNGILDKQNGILSEQNQILQVRLDGIIAALYTINNTIWSCCHGRNNQVSQALLDQTLMDRGMVDTIKSRINDPIDWLAKDNV